jgi:hypothetical protein
VGRFFNRVIRPHSVKNRIIVTAIRNEPSINNTHLPRLKKNKKKPPSAFGCVTYGFRFGGVRPPLSWYDLRLTPILNINLPPSEPIIFKNNNDPSLVARVTMSRLRQQPSVVSMTDLMIIIPMKRLTGKLTIGKARVSGVVLGTIG